MCDTGMKKILISAAEVSGDLHGAELVKVLKAKYPNFQFIGLGGANLKAEGMNLLEDISAYSTIGMLEPIRFLHKFLGVIKGMRKLMKREQPDLFLPIDSQGLNMQLLKYAKKLNIPSIYYISPQEWHWGTEKGGRKVLSLTNKILAVFKKEASFYSKLGGDAPFVGHPILDLAKSEITKEEFYKSNNISLEKRIVTVFLGTRLQEVRLVYPILLEAARLARNDVSDIQIVISINTEKYENDIRDLVEKMGMENIIFFKGNQYDLIANTYLSLTKSGTITLEHGVMGTPCIAMYRIYNFSYWFARTFFSKAIKRIKYISLPNIFLNKEIIPEYVQYDALPGPIAEKAILLLTDEKVYFKFKKDLLKIRDVLGEEGAVEKAAQEICDFIGV
jgi:lipid-A-disaccharide synthase